MSTYHEPVLREEALRLLLTEENGVYVDGTVGGGGHAEQLCERMGPAGRLIGFDADADAINAAGVRLARFSGQVTLIHSNFRAMKEALDACGVFSMNGVLFDLGVSSFQLDAGGKGFSFRTDERLDMRMDKRQSLSAWEVVNTYPEERLAAIVHDYGEEREARRIARRVVGERPVDTTRALGAIVERTVGGRFVTKSLARVFQALRIEVNDELSGLKEALSTVPDLLAPGGRCVVISYHSLEDRIVKEFFRTEAAERIPSA